MHMGSLESYDINSMLIAQETEGIDLIIDGHSHTELPQGLLVNNTLIAQTGCYGHYLGEVKIIVDDGKIISKTARLLNAEQVNAICNTPDKKVAKSLRRIEKQTQRYFNEVVTKSDRFLTAERTIVRRTEAEIGNLSADALRWRGSSDIAIMNGGNIRADLPEGNVTRENVLSIFPFGNKELKVEIDGATIKKMLEHSVSKYPYPFGGFLQVSGLTFTFNPDKPEGERVSEIFINNLPMDENKIYTMTTNPFLLSGGDGFDMLKHLKVIEEFETTEKIFEDYLSKVGIKDISLGRIKNLHEMPMPEK